jgi:hypothetical protein
MVSLKKLGMVSALAASTALSGCDISIDRSDPVADMQVLLNMEKKVANEIFKMDQDGIPDNPADQEPRLKDTDRYSELREDLRKIREMIRDQKSIDSK